MRAANAGLLDAEAAMIICTFSTPKFMNFNDCGLILTRPNNVLTNFALWSYAGRKKFKGLGKKFSVTLVTLLETY